jgi:hypothetical protein
MSFFTMTFIALVRSQSGHNFSGLKMLSGVEPERSKFFDQPFRATHKIVHKIIVSNPCIGKHKIK